jgi:glycosyltransferase involved in cell wall biosynthesis
VESIAEAMAQLLSQAELRETLRGRGLERSRRYTWAETARRTLAVYRAVGG